MKPKWSDVPEGYDWIAQDENGQWWAYEDEPSPSNLVRVWQSNGSIRHLSRSSSAPAYDWRNTLEKRPEYTKPLFLECYQEWQNALFGTAIKTAISKMAEQLTKGFKMNSCPRTKELTPNEQIDAKISRLNAEIEALVDRLGAIDDIKCSINWKTATKEMQNKAVEAADLI
jgi:hypothetical protein